MRVRPTLFCICFFWAVVFVVTASVVPAQEEMTLDEIISAYEESFANLRSLDITYASGHVTQWEGWMPKSSTDIPDLQPTRWRKSGDIERKDRAEHVGISSVLRRDNDQQDGQYPVVIRDVQVPRYAEYTDGLRLWRFTGDPNRTEHIGLLEPGKGFGDILPIPHNAILLGFPYYSFRFSLSIDKQVYFIAQILREFRTEIVDRKQVGNGQIITTRSYLPSVNDDPRRFIQISFDSSVGYFPAQIVFPFNMVLDETAIANTPYYGVRDFIEYHPSADGAFFPVKIIASQTDDINKLEGLEPIGKTAALSIILNEPVDVPAIEFPPGAIVVIEEDEQHTTYIWGENNEPLKVLTEEDYEEAARNRQVNLPPRENMPPLRIALVILGVIFIIIALRNLYAKDK